MAIPRNLANLAPKLSATGGSFATTSGVGAATPAASGAGITFPATQSASSDVNTLDDYEEGTFAFTAQFGAGNAKDGGGTITGYYTKIGRAVTLNGFINITKSAASGNLTITGVPFPSLTSTAVCIGGYVGIAFADSPSARIDTGQSVIDFFETTNAGTRTAITSADCAATFAVQFFVTYAI